MIYLNRFNEKLLNKKIDFVISDFDRTITNSDSATSWSVIPSSSLVDKSLKKESKLIFNHYRPIELDKNISFDNKSYNMKRWAYEQINLYKRYNITKGLLYEILGTNKRLVLRNDFSEFANKLNNMGIRLYIVSAGIYDVIKYILDKNNLLLDNISIISNHLTYDNNVISGISGTILHSCNKDSVDLDIKYNEYGLLFGDQVEDRIIGKHYNTYDIGFMSENHKEYDMVLTGNSSFNNVSKILIKE